MTMRGMFLVLSVALVCVFSSPSLAEDKIEYRISDVLLGDHTIRLEFSPENKSVRFLKNGKEVHPELVSVIVSITYYEPGFDGRKFAKTTVRGDVFKPIFEFLQLDNPSFLKELKFTSSMNNPFNALDEYRAFCAANGRYVVPTIDDLIERIAQSLARFENPDLPDIPGTYFYHLLQNFLYDTGLKRLEKRVYELSEGKVQIVREDGRPIPENGLIGGETPHTYREKRLLLVHKDMRYHIEPLLEHTFGAQYLGAKSMYVRQLGCHHLLTE